MKRRESHPFAAVRRLEKDEAKGAMKMLCAAMGGRGGSRRSPWRRDMYLGHSGDGRSLLLFGMFGERVQRRKGVRRSAIVSMQAPCLGFGLMVVSMRV